MITENYKENKLDWIMFAVLCLLGGSTWSVQKIGLNHSLPLWSSAMRFLIAGGTVTFFLIMLKRWSLSRKYVGLAIAYGIFYFSVPYGTVYWAQQYLSSGYVAVLASMTSVMLLIFNRFFRGVPATIWQITGVLLSLMGIIILFWHQIAINTSLLGIVAMFLVLLSMVCSAGITIIVRPHLAVLSILNLNALAMLVGGATLSTVSLIFETGERSFSGTNLLALIYLSYMGSLLGLGIYMNLLKKWHVSRASAHLFISPALALYLGALILKEQLTMVTYVGTGVILTGVMFINSQIIRGEKNIIPEKLSRTTQ